MSPPLVVMITGCSSGIGLATATYLAKEADHNFKVILYLLNLTLTNIAFYVKRKNKKKLCGLMRHNVYNVF